MSPDSRNDTATHSDDLEQGLPADALEAIRESEEQFAQGLGIPLKEAIARIRAEVGI